MNRRQSSDRDALLRSHKLSRIKDCNEISLVMRNPAFCISDLVGNPEDRFSHNAAQMKK